MSRHSSPMLSLHAKTPAKRSMSQLARCLLAGGVVALPTDAGYALVCCVDEKKALQRIYRIRQVDKQHYFTLLATDISDVSPYIHLSNRYFRLLKKNTPNPMTFIFPATPLISKQMNASSKRLTLGVRITDSVIVRGLIDQLGKPLLSTSLIPSGDERSTEYPSMDQSLLQHYCQPSVDYLVLLADDYHHQTTAVIDCTESEPVVLREGAVAVML